MKSILISIWLSAAYALDRLGQFISFMSGTADWSQVGWAFAASTSFVMYEVTQNVARSGWDRLFMVGLGLLVSLGLGPWISELTHIPIIPVTIITGAGGYKLYDWFIKKKMKDPEKSLKDFTGLNDDKT